MSKFWHTSERAGPTLWDVARIWDRTPRYLRTQERSKPAHWEGVEAPTRLTRRHASEVAEFWRTHYRGKDWWLDAADAWVEEMLGSSTTIAYGVFSSDAPHILIATILSRPLCGDLGYVLVGETDVLQTCRVIEGLCVHRGWRGRHVAGWLISWVDYITSSIRPTAHVWSRELPTYLPTTDIALHQYGYVKLSDLPSKDPQKSKDSPLPSVSRMDWKEFVDLWTANAPSWRSSDRMIVSCPFSERSDLDCLEVWKSEDQIVVIANTRRKTVDTSSTIWEILWCGTKLGSSHLQAALPTDSFRPIIEAVGMAEGRTGILFVSDAAHQGAATTNWPSPWKIGTSGYHSVNLYNFMPPAFWSCDTQFLRLDV